MRLFPMPPALPERPTATSPAETVLRGGWLLLARVLWLAVALFTLALFVASLPVALAFWQRICPDELCTHASVPVADAQYLQAHGVSLATYATLWVVFYALFALVWMGTGAIIFWRRSGDWLALMAACSLVTLGAWFSRTTGTLSVDMPGWFWPSSILHFLGQVAIFGFICLFPTGRFAPRWAAWLAALSLLDGAAIDFYFNTPLDSLNLPPLFWILTELASNVPQILVALARYHSVMTPVQRQQVKWVLVGGTTGELGFTGLELILNNLPGSVSRMLPLPFWDVATLVEYLMLLLIPLSFGMAILRSHLWEIDTLINKALVYGLLTGLLGALYAGLIIGLESLVRLFTGQAATNPIVLVVSTLAIALLFLPARRRIQASIDRRFYRKKYDAEKALTAFATTLRQETDLEQIRERLLAVVQEAMQPTQVSLWLRPPERQRPAMPHHMKPHGTVSTQPSDSAGMAHHEEQALTMSLGLQE